MGGDQRTHPADASYRPLGGPEAWADVPVDDEAQARGAERLRAVRAEAPAWADLVTRGASLAAAHQSAALAGLYGGGRVDAMALFAGASPSTLEPDVAAHVRAGHDAVHIASRWAPGGLSADAIRRLHAVACAPQVTHRVDGAHDHVLGHGDYKHHPNHVAAGAGRWRPAVPVDGVRAETARLAEALGRDRAGKLAPVVGAAYALHALHHVRPFADGNGRVARVLACATLLDATGLPLLAFADDAGDYAGALAAAEDGNPAALVRFVEQRWTAAVELVDGLFAAGEAERADGPLPAWKRRAAAAERLAVLLPGAARAALGRHRDRRDLGWMSPLAGTDVVAVRAPPGPDTAGVGLRCPLPSGAVLDETLHVDAHPLACDDAVVVRASVACLVLELDPAALLPRPSDGVCSALDAWLDRVVTSLAVAVAAESD